MEILERVFAAHPCQQAAQVVGLRISHWHGRRVGASGQSHLAIHAPARSPRFRLSLPAIARHP